MADDKLDLVVEISAHTQGLEGAARQASLAQDAIESLSRAGEIGEEVLKAYSSAGEKVSASLGDVGRSASRQLSAFEELQANVRSTTSALQELAQANVVAGGRNPLQDLAGSGLVDVDEAREILAIREAERVTAEQVAKAVIDAEEQKVQKVRESNDAIDQLQSARRNEELAELKAAISQRAAEEDKAFAKSKSLGEAEEQLAKARRQRELAEMRAFYKERAKLEESAQKKPSTTPGVQGGRDYGNFSVLYDAGIKARQDEAKAWSGVLQARMRDEVAAEKQAAANNRVTQSVREQTASLPTLRYALYDVSSTLMITGAAMTGLSVAAAAAAISMDRQFADVLRTSGAYLDSTGRSADSLRSSFEDLFTSMSVSWSDLTEIGTLAGQLNIAKDDIAEFTELVAMFAATTDVSVEQSATAFGRLSQLLDVPSTEFQNLGSSILAVGVNSVATESQIIAISSQIASMANSAGMSADEVFGLSSALASLGTQPELSRGVITRLFTNIQSAIAGGGERLEAFGRLTNQTGADFAKSWGDDAAGALLKMMEGLGKVEQSQAALVLKDLGITASRDVPTILRLAQNSEVLAESLQVAADGYRDGTALQEQYSVISSTVSEKIQVLINNLQNFVATLGQAGGAIGGVIDVAIGLVKVLTALIDNPITATIIGIAGAIAAIGGPMLLVTGLAVRGAASFIALRTALTEAAIAGGRVTSSAVAARLSLLQLAGAATTASGATKAFGAAARTALIGTGIGVALLAIGAAWEAVEAAINRSGRAFENYFGSAAGLQEALAKDSQEYAAAVESGNKAVADSYMIVERSSTGSSAAFDENKRTADAAAQIMGVYAEATDRASGATDNMTIALGANTLEWMKNSLAQSEAFRSRAGDQDFQQYLNLLSSVGFKMDEFLVTARDKGAEAARSYLYSFETQLQGTDLSEALNLKMDQGVFDGIRELSDAAAGLGEQISQTEAVNTLLGISAQETGQDLYDESSSALDLVNSLFEMENASIAAEDSIFRLGQSMFENGTAFDYYSEAGRANLSSLMAVMKAIAEESGGDAQVTAANYQALFEFIQREAPNAAGALNLIRNGISSLGVGKVASSGRDFSSFFGGWEKGAQRAASATRGATQAAREAREEIRTLKDYASDLEKVWSRAFEIRFSGSQTLDAITSSFISIREASEEAAKKIRDLKNDIQSLSSDISIQEYFLSIAIEYGDTKRAEAIEANLAKKRAELADKTAELQKEQDAASKSLVGNSKGAIENRKQIESLVQQYQAHIGALAASGMSQADLAVATQRLKADFMAQATQLGYNQQELQKYATAFDDVAVAIAKIPRNITVTASADPAIQAFNELQAAADRASNATSGLRNNLGAGFSAGGVNTSAITSAGLAAEAAMLRKKLMDATFAFGSAKGSALAPYTESGLRARLSQLTSWGYASGGYTGAGGKYEPAGLVHRGEYVIPKQDVNQRTGLPYADALGRLMGGIPGMASGGPTTGSGTGSSLATVALTPGTIQAIAQATGKVIVLDGRVIADSSANSYSEDNVVGRF